MDHGQQEFSEIIGFNHKSVAELMTSLFLIVLTSIQVVQGLLFTNELNWK